MCTRFGVDRSQRVKHGALLDAQLLAQVYVELTGGRQIGLGLVADTDRAEVAVGGRHRHGSRTARAPAASRRVPRNWSATARLSHSSPTRSGRASPRLVDGEFGAGPKRLRRPRKEQVQVDVRVAGHQVDTGELLREHAVARIEEITEKYFSRAIAANVTFGRGPNNDFTCDIVAPVAQGVVLKASHRAREAQMAFNGAADRIEKQLRRYIKRLREHKANGAQPYVENAGYTVFAARRPRTSEEPRPIRRSSPKRGSTFPRPACPTR